MLRYYASPTQPCLRTPKKKESKMPILTDRSKITRIIKRGQRGGHVKANVGAAYFRPRSLEEIAANAGRS